MDIGINKNGHDNITIALLYCQVQEREELDEPKQLSWKSLKEIIPDLPTPKNPKSGFKELLSSQQINSKSSLILIITLLFFGGTGLWFWHQQKSSDNQSSHLELRITDFFSWRL